MKVKSGRDFWAGTMFIAVGLWFAVVAQNYPMGSAVRMGPAYFPTILGGLLALLGVAITIRAFFSKLVNPLKMFELRPPMVVAAIAIGVATYFASDWFKDMPIVLNGLVGLSLCLFFAAFGGRALFLILLACLFFGYALKPLGLILAIVVLIVISALGGHDFRYKEVTILTVILSLLAVYGFVKGLGLPFNVWPGE